MLTALLVAAAFVAGVTGAWSPCGFSVVDTLGRGRARGGLPLVLASCAAFAAGAVAGGVLTFGSLAALGDWLGSGGTGPAVALAVAVAIVAAVGELREVRIVPQIRRQVPEHWRRTLPLPLASALYGVLLGLGFMTFVLTLAFWSLAIVALALGDLTAGMLAGAAFGLGRALPVAAMAPRYEEKGETLQAAMCERPVLLRRLRLVDGAMLAAVALALVTIPAEPARAAAIFAGDAADPSVGANGDLAWRRPVGGAILLSGGVSKQINGEDIAAGGDLLAVRVGAVTSVYDRADVAAAPSGLPTPLGSIATPDATGIAISQNWLVWRSTRLGVPEALLATRLSDGFTIQPLVVARSGEQISRPSLSGDRLAYTLNSRRTSSVMLHELAAGTSRRLRFSRTTTQLRGASVNGDDVLYVTAHPCWQRLVRTTVAAPSAFGTIWRTGGTARRDRGHERHRTSQGSRATKCPRPRHKRVSYSLGSTAFGGSIAYVTLLKPGGSGVPATASISRSIVSP